MKSRAIRPVVLLCAVCWTAVAGSADEFPSLRPGLWSFTSTVNFQGAVKPQARTMVQCLDPAQDIKRKWEQLAAQSCEFSPMDHEGNRYSYTSSCRSKGVVFQGRSSIIVENDSAYIIESESTTNSQATRSETIVAKRVGTCEI